MITSSLRPEDLSKVEKILGYNFQDQNLLRQALSHRSYSETNNERLEFLGDSIVNFLIGETLYHSYPEAHEGKLSRLRAYAVKKQSLYEVGTNLSLSEFILLGQGELRSGGHQRQSLIADCVEALIAAVFIDSKSMTKCRECVLQWFSGKLESLEHIKHLKDPKTRLQEHMQSQHLSLPTYEVAKVEGSGHDLLFEVICKAPTFKERIKGSGSSRRKAEQDAAQNVLALLES